MRRILKVAALTGQSCAPAHSCPVALRCFKIWQHKNIKPFANRYYLPKPWRWMETRLQRAHAGHTSGASEQRR
jgi:hypothetical protein